MESTAFEPCIPHLSQNITDSQIVQNKYRFAPNRCYVSHSGQVITIERLFVVYYCQWCLSVRGRAGADLRILGGGGGGGGGSGPEFFKGGRV